MKSNVKLGWFSKEMWLVGIGVLNYLLNRFGLPSFEPSAEFYGSLLLVMGGLRAWFTNARLVWRKSKHNSQ